MANLIINPRHIVKSTMLIRQSAKNGIYILVVNPAKDMGYDIPFPVTLTEYLQGSKIKGSSIRSDGLYIDDADTSE